MITVFDTGTHKMEIAEPPVKTLEQEKASAKELIHKKYQAIIDTERKKYSAFEIQTFASQEYEWRQWKADAHASTPTVDAIATARGITKEALMEKIETNILNIFAILGAQQKEEDALKVAKNKSEITAIGG